MSTRDAVADLLAQGLSVRAIADELGLATNTVEYHRGRLGLPAPPPRQPPPDMRATVGAVRTRQRVAALLEEGLSRAEIARKLGLSKPTVSYHARRLTGQVDERAARRYDWAAIQALYDAGHSMRECQAAFGFSSQTWHAAKNRGVLVTRPAAMPLEELLVPGVVRNRFHVKRRLVQSGLKHDACELCGLSTWRANPLRIELHHVNGDRHDYRLENLQLLCPNCHSQTENFSGRNRPRRAEVGVRATAAGAG